MADFISQSDFKSYQKDIDSRFYEYGRRIGEFASLTEDVKSLRALLSKCQDLIVGQSANLRKAIDELDAKIEIQMGEHNKLSHQIASQSSMIATINDDHSQTKNTVGSVTSFAKDTQVKVAQIARQMSEIANLKSAIDSVNVQLNGLRDVIKLQGEESYEAEACLAKDIKTLKDVAISVSKLKELYLSDKVALETKIDSSLNAFSLDISNLSEEFALSHKTLKDEFADQIAAIPAPVLPEIVSMSRISNIESQINNVALDVKNALLKASNVDLQTQIHAKKIEHVQLLLKQHELTQ